jgi:predicted alpha-1,6-mannanase (GH76 family)
MLKTVGKRVLSFLALSALVGCGARNLGHRQITSISTAPSSSYLQRSREGVQRLQQWYKPSSGLYETTGWWNSANAITVLADYARVSGSTEYNPTFANTFTQAQKTSPAFLNKFYDDEGWWALAWIGAYDATNNEQYLAMAESIFADMSQGWDDTCGGGIWWSKDRKYKNAIANELFLSVAAHLATRTSGAAKRKYFGWGTREWKWFLGSGMIDSKNLVNDGLDSKPQQTTGCRNNGRTTWSYNQGVVLGGLAELSRIGHDPSLLQAADQIATAATTLLVDTNGVLHDPCEPKCGADAVQFKGIFVRNLVLLEKIRPQRAYASFIDTNAESIWKRAQGPEVQFDETWSGPFVTANAASQTSALDAIVGAALLHTTSSHKP